MTNNLLISIMDKLGFAWSGWKPCRYYFTRRDDGIKATYFELDDEVEIDSIRYPSKVFMREYNIDKVLNAS